MSTLRGQVPALQRFGVPSEVLTDNGKQFTARFGSGKPGEVLFDRICRENGITHRLTKPRSPTTTGKIERFHQTLRTCPHANASLTCPVFVTGPEFLPELREQHTRTLTLIDDAKGCGHTRVAEMNQQVADNLDRMISQLEEGPDGCEEAADAS